MRSLEIHAPGDLRLVEKAPTAPGPGQVRLAVEYGGICGSDLGYWRTGVSGTAVMKRPFVLGHEISGRIEELGEGVTGLAVGQGVTVHPARTHSPLPAELVGRENLHPDLTYFGSAAQDPHTDGAFAQSLTVDADQIVPLPEGLSTRRAVLAEPLGVAMHAVTRAGDLTGKHVLVSGCGPVGLLVVLAARAAGAAHITAVDLAEDARERALALGADAVSDTTEGMDPAISVAFEASGAPASLDGIFRHIARAAIVVQVGNLPPTPVSVTLGPVGLLVVLAARAAGAAQITAVDLAEAARERALALGADEALESTDGMDQRISVAFEASGAPASLDGILRSIARAAIVVQVGNLPPTPVSMTLGPVVSKELEYRGTYRFVAEIEQAVQLLASSEVAEQVISDEFALEDAQAAFEAAVGRGSSKVVLTFA